MHLKCKILCICTKDQKRSQDGWILVLVFFVFLWTKTTSRSISSQALVELASPLIWIILFICCGIIWGKQLSSASAIEIHSIKNMDADIVWGSWRDEVTFLGFCISFVWFCLKGAFFPRGVLSKMAGAHGLLITAYTGRFYRNAKRYLFQASAIWIGGDFISWTMWKCREICHFGR